MAVSQNLECEAPSVLCDILQCTLLVYAEDLLLGISTI